MSCPTKRNGQLQRRLCKIRGGVLWEAVRAFCENIMLLDTWDQKEVLI